MNPAPVVRTSHIEQSTRIKSASSLRRAPHPPPHLSPSPSPPLPLHFSPLRRSQPEISEFVWNSLPVLLGAIEADRPTDRVQRRRQRSGRTRTARRSDRKRMDHASHGRGRGRPRLYSMPPPSAALSCRSFQVPELTLPAGSPPLARSSPRRFATRPLTESIVRPPNFPPN